MPEFKGVIFTPNDEPYLGLPEVKALDDVIVSAMDEMQRAKPYTASEKLTTHQKAAILIIPSGVSLCLSVRELIRQAYLHGALVLLRPILERMITIQYLRLHPDAHAIWENGWKYQERPKLHEMTKRLFSDRINDELEATLPENNWTVHQVLTREGNDMVHGGVDALLRNVNFTEQGTTTSPGKVVNRPDLAKKAALECASWLSILVTESSAAFPES